MESELQVQPAIIPDNSVELEEDGAAAPIEFEGVCDVETDESENGAKHSSRLRKASTSSTEDSNHNYESKATCTGVVIPQDELRAGITQPSPVVPRKVVTRVEVVVLVVVVAIVWGLLTLPIIFYYLPSVSQSCSHDF